MCAPKTLCNSQTGAEVDKPPHLFYLMAQFDHLINSTLYKNQLQELLRTAVTTEVGWELYVRS